ncbi:sensor histidine kinase [Desulfovirgula thermocuniculi]|uniref:sensor histidine kinase n=1 Tax=Desulfovirgula thermocuniculi TaxID=348842 RepID=UPI00041E3AE7|nr:ATP-binding protein [Desulfovirgula thermocuniculi]
MGTSYSPHLLAAVSLGPTFVVAILVQHLFVNGYDIPAGWMALMGLVVGGNVILSLVLMHRLISLEQQAFLAQQQARYIEHMEELIRNIRSQRHDFISHLQAVYGLLQLGYFENARQYIAEVAGEARMSTQTLRLNMPEVAALIQRKGIQAANQNIAFSLSIESELKGLPMRPYHLNRILGNLLDNAMEAVMVLEPQDRFVKLEIREDEKSFIFVVSNSGPEIREEWRERIFEPGFSTKGPGRGLGLAIVKETVAQHGGEIKVSFPPITFTVTIPKNEAVPQTAPP